MYDSHSYTHASYHPMLLHHTDMLCFPFVCSAVQLPSAVLTLLPNQSSSSSSSSSSSVEPAAIRFYTTGLLVLLPFPDMSMPFNVVAFTSTVLAFFFGSLFNLTYSTTAAIIQRSQQTPIARIRAKLQALLGRCRRRVSGAAKGEAHGVGVGVAGTQQVPPAGEKVMEREEEEEVEEEKKEVAEQVLDQWVNETTAREMEEMELDTGISASGDMSTRRRKVNMPT